MLVKFFAQSRKINFDLGGKFDKSILLMKDSKKKQELSIEFEVTNPSQREQAIAKMAERKSNVIIGIRFCPSRCY